MPAAIPPWLAIDRDPVGAFIKSYQIGASIGEAQSRLAEQQRQANMELVAKREAMQENVLRAQQELAVEAALKQQAMGLEQAKLAEEGRRNEMAAIQAAASLNERADYHNAMAAQKQNELAAQNAYRDMTLGQRASELESLNQYRGLQLGQKLSDAEQRKAYQDKMVEQGDRRIAATEERTKALSGQEKVWQGPNGSFFKRDLDGNIIEIRPPYPKDQFISKQKALDIATDTGKYAEFVMRYGKEAGEWLKLHGGGAIPKGGTNPPPAVAAPPVPIPAPASPIAATNAPAALPAAATTVPAAPAASASPKLTGKDWGNDQKKPPGKDLKPGDVFLGKKYLGGKPWEPSSWGPINL